MSVIGLILCTLVALSVYAALWPLFSGGGAQDVPREQR
jgi:hypothetical protein